MTGPKGNSEFCFPETSLWPQSWTLKVEGKQNSLFLEGPVIKCFVIPPNSKLEKKLRKKDLFNTTVAVPAVWVAVKPSCPTETTQKQYFSSQLTKNKDNIKVALPFSNA